MRRVTCYRKPQCGSGSAPDEALAATVSWDCFPSSSCCCLSTRSCTRKGLTSLLLPLAATFQMLCQ